MKKIIFASILILLASFFITKSPQVDDPIVENIQKTKSPQPINDITKNWQEYKNEKYSYLIKYPQDWYFHPQTMNPPPPRAIFLANVVEGETQGNYASFTVLIDDSLGRNLTNHSEITESIDAGFIQSDLVISGSPAVMLIGSNQNQFISIIYVLHKSYFYRLGWQATDEKTYNLQKEIFRQIIATFKFTNLPVKG